MANHKQGMDFRVCLVVDLRVSAKALFALETVILDMAVVVAVVEDGIVGVAAARPATWPAAATARVGSWATWRPCHPEVPATRLACSSAT